MFINKDGNWECEECGAWTLLYRDIHRPGCSKLSTEQSLGSFGKINEDVPESLAQEFGPSSAHRGAGKP